MSNTYKLGTAVKVTAAFTDLAGIAFDPSSVVCAVQKPSDAAGADTAYTYGVDAQLVRDDVGAYHLWIATDEVGTWAYRFTGDDPGGDIANEDTFEIETDFR